MANRISDYKIECVSICTHLKGSSVIRILHESMYEILSLSYQPNNDLKQNMATEGGTY
jgi:hypothetical protein